MNSEFVQTTPIVVSRDELFAFHNIDRNLYTRLVIGLVREPTESMNVMGLWIWYERSRPQTHLVAFLNTIPDNVLIAFTNESVWVLKSIESNEFTDELKLHMDIPLTVRFTTTNVNLLSFFENRASILAGVKRSVDEVCLRAFNDLYQQAMLNWNAGVSQMSTGVYWPSYPNRRHSQAQQQSMPQNLPQQNGQNVSANSYGVLAGGNANQFHPYDPSFEPDYQRNQLYGFNYPALSQPKMGDESAPVVHPNQRTILIIFFKGYPVSEGEIKEFFTKNFGDCVEAIYVEVVGTINREPMNARVVVQSPEHVDFILGATHTARFTINGKHVWACKFVGELATSPAVSLVLPNPLY